ncbi:MAG TPA: hypothetical protein VJB92_00125 [Candidatus Paceibacterota bacterium]
MKKSKVRIETIFWSAAAALFLLAMAYTVISIRAAAVSLKAALYEDPNSAPPITRFDFEALDKLLSGKNLGTPTPRL